MAESKEKKAEAPEVEAQTEKAPEVSVAQANPE